LWRAQQAKRYCGSSTPNGPYSIFVREVGFVHQSISQPRCTAANFLSFQINALNLVEKIGRPSSFGENSRIRRENAGMFRLSTLKVARKSFVFKGV
jgi:hypothetical protein